MELKKADSQVFKLIEAEKKRQLETLMMIPSENYASQAVMEATGSILTNKYSEGYPGKRYYQGNQIIDDVENLAIERAMELFEVPYANVQALSGSPANLAIYFALCEPGDKIMGMRLADGGHLTHGYPKLSASGKFFTSVQYGVGEDGLLDFDAIRELAEKEKPKVMVCGFTAYPRLVEFSKFAKIADSVGAWLVADISHIAGLVVGKMHPSPMKAAHVVMTTTHKTLRGPRGALIMVTKKGLRMDKDLGKRIDKAIIPGLQGGPHNHVTAGIAVALREASKAGFKSYARKVVQNANVLGDALMDKGWALTTGGTDTHLLLADMRPFEVTGKVVACAMEVAGMIMNANSIPNDPAPPYRPSGLRFGSPGMTTRGMAITQMRQIAEWMHRVAEHVQGRKADESGIYQDWTLRAIGKEVAEMALEFPVPGVEE
jgi:glycine hydroxymethyltransferase